MKEIALAIIEFEGHILIGQIRQTRLEEFNGIKYVFPGGKIETSETPANAAIREAQEETGLIVTVIEKIGERLHPQAQRRTYYFHCKAAHSNASPPPDDDIETLLWVEPQELLDYMPTLFDGVKRYFGLDTS